MSSRRMETSEGNGVIRGHCDLLYDPKGHDDIEKKIKKNKN